MTTILKGHTQKNGVGVTVIVETYIKQLQEIAEAMINEAPRLARVGYYDESNLEAELGTKLTKFLEEFCLEHDIH